MNKTYAFTDVHGRYELWRQIKEYCDDSDIIYFLGDACDRGDDGIKIMRELFLDKRVIYLKGNHEEFIEDIGAEIAEGHYFSSHLWRMNGGFQTLNDFEKLSESSQLYFIRKIMKLNLTAEYINKKGQKILLSHAGYTPTLEPLEKESYYWDRSHFGDEWPSGDKYKNTYIIYGHTPVDYLRLSLQKICMSFTQEKRDTPIYYCDGHKIDLDLASFDSGRIALFDLDELKVEKIFFDETILEECE